MVLKLNPCHEISLGRKNKCETLRKSLSRIGWLKTNEQKYVYIHLDLHGSNLSEKISIAYIFNNTNPEL